MKKLNAVLTIVLCLLFCACGSNSEKKQVSEDSQKEAKKETKKPSKSTKEGMMALLEESGIKVPGELEYIEVKKKSTSYNITFAKEEVDETTQTKLDEWFTSQINNMVKDGWKKKALRENEEMIGFVINEIVMYPPEEKKIDVNYGLTLSTSFDKEKKAFKFYVSAN